VRTYPNGKIGGATLSLHRETDAISTGIIDNHETLWPETEGREGLEQTFNPLLIGKHGEYKITFDKDAAKLREN